MALEVPSKGSITRIQLGLCCPVTLLLPTSSCSSPGRCDLRMPFLVIWGDTNQESLLFHHFDK